MTSSPHHRSHCSSSTHRGHVNYFCSHNSSLSLLLVVFVIAASLSTVPRVHAATPTTTAFPSPTAFTDLLDYFPTNGPLDDAACNVEDLEQANDSQLHVILQEVTATQFFRNFIVDLDAKCPLQSWRRTSKSKSTSHTEHDSDNDEVDEEEDEEEEEEFKCAGEPEEEDAPPLCQVDGGGGSEDPFLQSNALFSISQGGFESKAQKDTFAWKQQTDMVVVDEEGCDPALLPDEFWVDICSNIQAGDGTKVVNLAKNPERNTAYNGTHIWNAIYEENCFFCGSEKARVMDKDTPDNGMCFEERVLYRLLSGLHTSTTLSIAMNYYPPSKRKGRLDWQPNPDYFMQKFKSNPQHIRNLHFSYVVLLRALQKARSFLYNYEIRTGDIVQDETATILLRRLLDSAILQSCSNVFSAFDESLMFRDADVTLQKNFKGVFHNVSAILDCVQCQQCKLHGKLTMLGYGTALKVLFMEQQAKLTRNEVVALINTIAKLSESVRHVRELTHLYWQQEEAKLHATVNALPGGSAAAAAAPTPMVLPADHITTSIDLVDAAVGAVAALGQEGEIGWERESELVSLALERNPELLILAKYYGTRNPTKFLELSKSIRGGDSTNDAAAAMPDAIVVGSGLAGLAASLNILDRGGTVVIIEKEHLLGGNSNKASSGINACCPDEDEASSDSVDIFRNDTTRSAGTSAKPELIETLVTKSGSAVMWLKERVGVDLSLKAQLGGHSSKRTHRPSNGMAGAEIIYGMQKAVKSYEKTGRVTILTDTKVKNLITEQDGKVVVGVEYVKLGKDGKEGSAEELRSPNVILATGGFAADRSGGSYLEKHRPELLKMPTTAGAFSTGDGIALATSLGAGTVDMDKVQVHPTGWVDPSDPDNTSKILAAELMRGVGGLLINKDGMRFCNELGTRAYVTDKMLSHDAGYAKSGEWDVNATVPTFSLVLSSSAAADAKKHVDLYSHKGLLKRLAGVQALADWMGLPKTTVVQTLKKYQEDAAKGSDEFQKNTFRGVPAMNLDTEVFYAGTVTPVLHYCMGGITIDKDGNVLNQDGERIRGLHAAGEVTGGVHGVNRLAGNSLLECTVFGTIVGQKIPIQSPSRHPEAGKPQAATPSAGSSRDVSMSELQKHNTEDDCWVAIHGVVYDLTEFAEEHPAGPGSIYELAGRDGTEAFAAVHNEGLLDDFVEDQKGILKV